MVKKTVAVFGKTTCPFYKKKKKNVATIGILTVSTLKCRTQYDRKVKTNDMENEMMVAL